jgi:hypothetical protein
MLQAQCLTKNFRAFYICRPRLESEPHVKDMLKLKTPNVQHETYARQDRPSGNPRSTRQTAFLEENTA